MGSRQRSVADEPRSAESALARFEDALHDHGSKGGRGMWTCPSHQDRCPSLSVKAGDDGRVLVHCFGGCATLEVVGALGLAMRDLFDAPAPKNWRPPPRRRVARCHRGQLGLPTWDSLFWSQDENIIDSHFARLPSERDLLLARVKNLIAGLARPS
jgi:hypothetical protein